MKTKRNAILLDNLQHLAQKNHYIGVFGLASCRVNEIETIRRAANAENVRLQVVKNTILKLTVPDFVKPLLKQNIIISSSESPAGCVGFLPCVKNKELRAKMTPLVVLDWNSGRQITHPISDLITMKNLNGMYGRVILQLKMPYIKLFNLLKAIAHNPQ